MKKILTFLITLVLTNSASALLITNVDRTHGQKGFKPPIGFFTGETDPLKSDKGGLQIGSLAYSDELYYWTNMPKNISRSEYVRTFNEDGNKCEKDVTYNFTLTEDAIVWIAIDSINSTTSQHSCINDLITLWGYDFQNTYTHLTLSNKSKYNIYASNFISGKYKFGALPTRENFYTFGVSAQTIPSPKGIVLTSIGTLIVTWIRRKRVF